MPQQSFAALVLFVLGFLSLWGLAYFLLRRQERHALKVGGTEEDELSTSLFWEQGKREQKAVKSALAAMSRSLDETHLYRDVCEAISRGFHFSHVWIEMKQTPTKFSVPACHPFAFARDGRSIVPKLSKLFVDANLTKTYKNLDRSDDPELMPLQSRGLAFVAGIPLGHTGKAWGVLYLGDAAHRDVYHATIESIQLVADHLSLVIERLRSERTIERQTQLLRALMKSTADALVVLDENGSILQKNTSFDTMFGLPEDQCIGQQLGRYVRRGDDFENDELLLENLKTVGSSGQWFGLEGASRFPLRISVGEYRPDSETKHWVLWLTDVSDLMDRETALTEVRSTQEATRASEGRLLGKISYALRTPLESIIASSGLLGESQLDAEQRDFVEGMRNGVDAMITNLGDTLDILETRTRQLEMREEPFTLHTMLEDLCSRFHKRSESRNVDLLLHVDPNTPSALVGDVVRLRQILYHMLDDALHRTRKGHLYLRISEESRSFEGHGLCFNLSYTGDAPDPLWQTPSEAKNIMSEAFSDSDIGLINSLHLIHKMAGTTIVGSSPEGSKLELRLNLPAGEPTSSDHLRIFDNLQATLWGHGDYQSMILQDILREYGIESDVFDDLNQALEHLRESSGTNNGQLLLVPFKAQQALIPDLLTYFVEDTLLSGINLVLVTDRQDRSTVTELFSHGRIFSLPYPYRRRDLGQILTSCSGQIEAGEAGHGVVGRYASPSEQRARLLYIEDNAINRHVCRRLLERWGFHCDVAGSGHEALDLLRQGSRYDMILVDCIMPDIDGFTASLAIRTQEDRHQRTPIVGMSQQESAAYQQRCKEAGMDALLLKPLTPMSLYRALKKFLNGKGES